MVLKAFISSRTEELASERDIAERVIGDHKFLPDRWEKWTASSAHSEDVCRKHTRESDMVIFIVGSEFSEMVAKEYDEARTRKKQCLIFVKEVTKRDQRLQELINNEMSKHVFFKKYANLEAFENELDKSISNLVEERFTSYKEKAMVQHALKLCSMMNENVLKAKFLRADDTQAWQLSNLDTIKLKLIEEKMKIEAVLRDVL